MRMRMKSRRLELQKFLGVMRCEGGNQKLPEATMPILSQASRRVCYLTIFLPYKIRSLIQAKCKGSKLEENESVVQNFT